MEDISGIYTEHSPVLQKVGVRFMREGKVYTFSSAGLNLRKGDRVIVETEHGLTMGTVSWVSATTPGEDGIPTKQVIRTITAEDLKTLEENRDLEQEAKVYCIERVKHHGLAMKVIDVECLFDRSKVIFFFTADNRVDFRELVKDLVQRFRLRIELRQIGARQEARLLKGLGICGREVCCAGMLPNLDRVSVKMAKEQGMSLNPEKISGLCGRLMCCLAYEYDTYMELKKFMPKCGKSITTEQGRGKIIRQNVLNQEVVVLLESGKETTIPLSDIKT